MNKAFETELIRFSFEIRVDNQPINKVGLDANSITQTILSSPWVGNQPLKDCLKPGQHYDWGFNHDSGGWLDWEFTLKPTVQKKDCVQVLKQAVQGFIELNQLA